MLRHNLGELAFLRLRFDFLDPPHGACTQKGTFQSIPKLVMSLPPDNVLAITVQAVALANFAARTRRQDVSVVAQTYYGKALSALRGMASKPSGGLKDQTLLSAHILSLYEALSKPEFDGSFPAHLLGSETMMEEIATGTDITPSSPSFMRSGFGVLLVKHALFRHLGYYSRLPSWLSQLVIGMPESCIQSELMHIVCDAIEHCAALKETHIAASSGQPLLSQPRRLLDEAKALDVRFDMWESQLSPELLSDSYEIRAPRRKTPWVRDLFGRPGAPTRMDVARSTWRVHEWNFYRTARLNLQCCMLDLVEALETRHRVSQELLHNSSSGSLGSTQIPTQDPYVFQHGFSNHDVNNTVSTVVRLGHSMLQSLPHTLGVQPPSPATLRSSPLGNDTQPFHSFDPRSLEEVSGLRGYHLFWPLFNLLKCFTRSRIRRADHFGMESWVKYLLHFLWLELGIAQAEGYRRWYDRGLPAGW